MGQKAHDNVKRFKIENIALQWKKIFETVVK